MYTNTTTTVFQPLLQSSLYFKESNFCQIFRILWMLAILNMRKMNVAKIYLLKVVILFSEYGWMQIICNLKCDGSSLLL